MKLISVRSSFIRAIGYRANTRTLQLLFKSGKLKTIRNFPPDELSVMLAGSIGKYFNEKLRKRGLRVA